MAFLNICGFETGDVSESYAAIGGGESVQSTTKRTGAYALQVVGGGGLRFRGLDSAGASVALGRTAATYYTFYLRVTALPTTTVPFFSVHNTAVSEVVRGDITSGGVVTLVGSSTSATVATLTTGIWYRIEVKVLSNGTSEMKVDGGTAQTCTANNVTQDAITLGGTTGASQTVLFDDLALDDTAYTGPGQVNILKPNGAGSYTDWTGTYADVDEVPHDSDTTYIEEAGGALRKEHVALESTATGGVAGSIGAVKACWIQRRSAGASAAMHGRVKSGASDGLVITNIASASYAFRGHVMSVDPNTSAAWATAAVDALEVGVQSNDGTATYRVTAMYAMVWSTGIEITELGPGAVEYTGYPVTMADLQDVGAGAVEYTGHPVALADGLPVGAASIVYTGFPLTISSPIDPTPSTAISDAQVADALAGKFGPVRIRRRFEWRDHGGNFLADLTGAVLQASIDLDNNRAVVRTARLTILPSRLPAGFDPFGIEDVHLAIFLEVAVNGSLVRYQQGLYHFDRVVEVHRPRGQEIWEVSAADVSIHLLIDRLREPLTVAAGSLYTETAEAICQAAGLRTAIVPSTHRTPVALPFPPDTPRGTVVNDLLKGINYFPAWADRTGQMVSRSRLDPSAEAIAVEYRTDATPRMIRPGFSRVNDSGLYLNQASLVVQTASRAPLEVRVTNDDDDSPISTLAKAGVTSQQFSADRVLDASMMAEVGAWLVRDASVKSQVGTLVTHPDPRREAHETYRLRIEGIETATLWRCERWSYDLTTGVGMTHHIGRASHVDVTTEVFA